MSEQQPDPEGLTDEAISPDQSPDVHSDLDERTDPDLANTVPGRSESDPESEGDAE